ncbi:MAG: MBOAT family protein [Lachnospiraceae bacterium]|nr:MBOAT family protein [Lachnospiraceae bacterium]
MVFSSLLFLFRFLPIVLILYFIAPRKLKNAVLFLSSLVFYAWGEPVYVVLMLFSTVVDYTHGMLVDKFRNKGEDGKAKLIVASSMIINLALLGFFKYSDFLIGSINSVFGTSIPLLNLALPIGISFYTFQTMSYTVDVYRREAKVQRNIISFGAYVALFPQLIAGPIVRFQTIAEELDVRKETVSGFSRGINRFMIGLGKKILLANNIGMLWDSIKVMGGTEMSVAASWLGVLAFAFQIYFDFSGYSDMAIGLGSMFGFNFPENFNYPYVSKSVSEFWRRWHISLGTWFREYLYIPLGGNRCTLAKQIRNLAIVWLATGIWHGASWNFVLWGVYYGAFIIMEKVFFGKVLKKLPAWVQHVYTLLVVAFGWVIFAFDSLKDGLSYIKTMIGLGGVEFVNQEFFYLLLTNIVWIVIMILGSTELPKKCALSIMSALKNKQWIATTLQLVFYVVVFIVALSYLVDATYNPFLYFRF